MVSGEGSIYIGDTKGVTVFSENEFNKTGTANENSNFYFSELWVDNKTIIPGDDTGILSQSLPYTRELKLNYDQNNLIIHFALSDYGQQLSENGFNISSKVWTRIGLRLNRRNCITLIWIRENIRCMWLR